MKKSGITLIFTSIFIFSIYSQNEKHEISIGQGVFTPAEKDYFMKNILIAESIYYGATSLYYKYRISTKFQFGCGFSYDYGRSQNEKTKRRLGSTYYFTYAVEGDYIYLQNKILRLYSTLGFGVTFEKEKDTYYKGSFEKYREKFIFPQFTLLGIKYGKKYGGFLEFGFGYKGTSIGVYARL